MQVRPVENALQDILTRLEWSSAESDNSPDEFVISLSDRRTKPIRQSFASRFWYPILFGPAISRKNAETFRRLMSVFEKVERVISAATIILIAIVGAFIWERFTFYRESPSPAMPEFPLSAEGGPVLSGRVRDSQTHEAIRNALVIISAGDQQCTVTTDETGFFRCQDLLKRDLYLEKRPPHNQESERGPFERERRERLQREEWLREQELLGRLTIQVKSPGYQDYSSNLKPRNEQLHIDLVRTPHAQPKVRRK